MLDPNAKPEVKDILTYRDALLRQWQEAHAQFANDDAFYTRKFEVWTGQPSRPYTYTSRPTAIVDHAVDTQLTFDPTVHREPLNEREDAQESADRLENALAAILRDAILAHPEGNPYKKFGKQLTLYGYGVMKGMTLDLHEYAEKPKRNEGEKAEDYDIREMEWNDRQHGWNPFRLQVPHPTDVLMNPLERVPAIALHAWRGYAHEIAALSTRKAKQGKGKVYEIAGKDAYDQLQVLEYWSSKWHVVLAEDNLLYAEPNFYGFQPFIHAYAGWGQTPADVGAKRLEGVNPKYIARGILWPVKELLVLQAQLVSTFAQAAFRKGWARRIYAGDAADAIAHLQADVLPGKEGDWDIEPTPEMSSWMFETLAGIDRDIELATYNTQLAGFNQSNVTTVGQTALLQNNINKKFAQLLAQANHVASITASNALRLLPRLQKVYDISTMRLGKTELRLTDIRDNFRVDVEFKQVDPMLRLQQTEQAQALYREGLVSGKHVLRTAGIEDTSGMARERMVEDVKRTPEVANALMLAAMEEVGYGDVAEEIRKRQAMERQEAEMGQTGGGPLPSEQPRGPMEAGNPATQLRRLRQGLSNEVQRPPTAGA